MRERRVVIRFDLSGVPRCRTGLRLHWLVLEPSNIEVCYKDPGYPVDAVVLGDVSVLIAAYLGHTTWREATRCAIAVRGEREVVRNLEKWLRLNQRIDRELPIVPPAA